MAHYIISFTVYTMAMSGLIAFALFIYRKIMGVNSVSKKTKILSIEETMSINPRKTLMIVKAGNERFLLASDVDKTSLIAKLESNETLTQSANPTKTVMSNTKSTIVDLNSIKNNIDKENMDVLFPKKTKKETKTLKNTPQPTPKKDKTENTKKTVHLEVISDRNPNAPDRNRQHSYTVNRRRNVTIDVGEVKNHGLSTIKEILHKVNEL